MSGHKGEQVLGHETSAGKKRPPASACRVSGGATVLAAVLITAGVALAGGVIEISACE